MVGLGRVELPTSPLSGARSDQLSYRPSRRPSCRRQDCPSRQHRVSRSPATNGMEAGSPDLLVVKDQKAPEREAQASQNRIVMRRDPDV
jgi:hypothetical protein